MVKMADRTVGVKGLRPNVRDRRRGQHFCSWPRSVTVPCSDGTWAGACEVMAETLSTVRAGRRAEAGILDHAVAQEQSVQKREAAKGSAQSNRAGRKEMIIKTEIQGLEMDHSRKIRCQTTHASRCDIATTKR